EALASSDDRAKLVIFRSARAFAVMNLYPYNNGHLLVAPHLHAGSLNELSREERNALFELTHRAVRWLEQVYHPHGFNIGLNLGLVAGAGLPGHLHVHIVPRWNGDTNFMPVLGETKVISEDLWDSYDRIKAVIQRRSRDES
ncbi:MAG: HIT domain-containing protein, partial [Calditrichota bacterium]